MSQTSEHNPWKPDKPISKGAIAYHDAVSKAEYYIAILDELIKITSQKIKEGHVVVDFGAGTGVSASRLLDSLKVNANLWLVDNSAAWLGKAYEVIGSKQNVKCFLLEKKKYGYATLAETIGKKVADHVISANTVHLIPDIEETFKGIANSLKDNGTFTFQSGNITRERRPEGALMVDDTVRRVHDIALEIVKTDERFADYAADIDERVKKSEPQRKFVFPDTRPIEVYLEALKKAKFKYEDPYYKLFKVKYDDWLKFLRVRRLQAGILPEIGGNYPSQKEESDRDLLITLATNKLFEELRSKNQLADDKGFTLEITYVTAKKAEQVNEKGIVLAGRIALVTGASRGIGKAIAIELAKQGADVIVNYNRNDKDALEVVSRIKEIGCRSIAVKADVANFDEVGRMFEIVKKEFGRVDILVNNAGIIMDKTLRKMTQEEWNKVIDVNLNSIYNVTKNALPLLQKNSRVISISSIVGLYGNFGQANYAASKAGIIGFTKSLAKELGKYGITVNAIAPGFIESDMSNKIPFLRKKIVEWIIPLKRIGKPEEVAYAAAFLASEDASYITGQVLSISGGLSI